VRIASLQPFATDILARCGVELDLVAVTHLCSVPKSCGRVPVVTRSTSEPYTFGNDDERRLAQGLSSYSIDLKQLSLLSPDVIITDIQVPEPEDFIVWAEDRLRVTCGKKVQLFNASIQSLPQMAEVVEEIGGLVGGRAEARVMASKTQAQLMAWADSFFERCKGKRVVVLSGIKPIVVAERWIPDLVRMVGAKSLEREEGKVRKPFTWEQIVAARPDVIVVAPEGASLAESVKTLS
jgi:iron complex transport system substrate-binding protein